MTRTPRTARRGGVYVLVLTTSAITVSMGLLAMQAVTAQRDVTARSNDAARAMLLAESAIELALHEIDARSNWRTSSTVTAITPTTIEGGTLSATIEDPDDNDLADGNGSRIRITGEGVFGQARQRLSVIAEQDSRAIEALEYPIVIHGGASGVGELCGYTRGNPIPFCAGGFLQVPISVMYAPGNMTWIDLPDPSVVQQYAAMGTQISIADSIYTTEHYYVSLELSSDNTSGVTPVDRNGIYVIDGAGGPVDITRLSLVGTLVITNASMVHFELIDVLRVGADGHPVIVTDSPLLITYSSAAFVNGRVDDTDDKPDGPDFDDPSFDGIQGIIYVDNDITIEDGLDVRGALMATGSAVIDGDVTITYNDAYRQAPPPGFRVDEGLTIVEGSYREIIDD